MAYFSEGHMLIYAGSYDITLLDAFQSELASAQKCSEKCTSFLYPFVNGSRQYFHGRKQSK